MSRESWLFLFGIISALTGVGSFIFQYLQYKNDKEIAPVKTRKKDVLEPSQLRRGLHPVGIISLTISLVLSSMGFFLSISKGGPPSSMQISSIDLPKIPLVEVSKPIGLNVRWMNFGPGTAFDIDWHAQIVLLHAPISESIAEAVWKDFRNIKREKMNLDGAVGFVTWNTFWTRNITEQDAKDIEQGKLVIYVLTFMNYRDGIGDHEVEGCRFLQPPGDKPVWHMCSKHNRIR